MNIRHAILGLLSMEPLTGYDIKKTMEKSPLFHWSGNNSQIYRVMGEIQSDGLVTAEILHKSDSPTKKLYTLTERGRRELSDMSRAYPELPEIRLPFLVQLVFAGDLSRNELETLLNQYEGEVRGVLLSTGDTTLTKTSTPLASAIQGLALENIRQFYQNELAWLALMRREVVPLADNKEKPNKSEATKMEFKATDKNGQTYVTVTGGQIIAEQDGIALVTACAEHGTNLLMLPADCLSDEFLRLSSKVLGFVLQKLVNYNIKAAAVLDEKELSPRFKEFLLEANRGHTFRAFNDFDEAEEWLLGGNER